MAVCSIGPLFFSLFAPTASHTIREYSRKQRTATSKMPTNESQRHPWVLIEGLQSLAGNPIESDGAAFRDASTLMTLTPDEHGRIKVLLGQGRYVGFPYTSEILK